MAVVCAILSALFFALGASLQHREASAVTSSGVADVRLIWKLCHRRWWLAGVVADLSSMTLHVVALSLGTLAVVQPLGVSGLIFAIPLSALLHRVGIRRADVFAATAVVLGLVLFLKSLPPSRTVQVPSTLAVAAWPALALLAVSILTCAGHFAPGRPRSLLLAGGAGTAFGMTAVLVRVLLIPTGAAAPVATIVVSSIAILVLGLGGYLLLQGAYRSGHFPAAVAVSTVLNPTVAVLVGSGLLHEGLPHGVAHLTMMVIAIPIVCVGIGRLAHSPTILSQAPVDRAPRRDLESMAA